MKNENKNKRNVYTQNTHGNLKTKENWKKEGQ